MTANHIASVPPDPVSGFPVSPQASGGGLREWLDERLGLSALTYPVPAYANTFWYTLGGITFVGFVFLILTGIYLAQFYHPHPAQARDSVLYIQNVAPLGDLIRGVHVWLASLVTITALLHLLRIFVTASYKRPREVNWLVGVALLAITLSFVFTGSVLRWDQEAWEALQHNTEAAELLGNIGTWFTAEFAASVPILERLYLTHVSLLPVLLFILLVLHFFLVKRHGISPLPAQADAGEAPDGVLPKARLTGSYTEHLRKMAGFGLVLIGLAGILAVLVPPGIGAAADPSMEVTKPAWMFYWLYAFEGPFGVRGILYAAIFFFGLLVLVPVLDRSPWRSPRLRRIAVAVGLVVVLAIVALSLYVWLSPTQQHLEEVSQLLNSVSARL
jgi:quinol-cytochrome oxidoreductase complex cytochrome b subunit